MTDIMYEYVYRIVTTNMDYQFVLLDQFTSFIFKVSSSRENM